MSDVVFHVIRSPGEPWAEFRARHREASRLRFLPLADKLWCVDDARQVATELVSAGMISVLDAARALAYNAKRGEGSA